MSNMQTTISEEIIAILASDIHLQAKPPTTRSGEQDWFAAMARPLNELRALQKRCNGVPIFYAGDIFDRWYSSPEVINFALEYLPSGYAIPGQHDLPNHNYAEIKRSAYWTLVKANVIKNIHYERPMLFPDKDIMVYGFPWGSKPEPVQPDDDFIRIAIIHAFVWTKDTGYQGAPVTSRIGAYRKALSGYDAVAFGDNHKGFIKKIPDGPWVCNCGGFMRRKADEIDYRPGCGLLHADGSISRYHFTTAEEFFSVSTESENSLSETFNMEAFTDALHELGKDGNFDFGVAINRFIASNNIPEETAKMVLESYDKGNEK